MAAARFTGEALITAPCHALQGFQLLMMAPMEKPTSIGGLCMGLLLVAWVGAVVVEELRSALAFF